MESTTTGVRDFFERYAAASQKEDVAELAALYADTFIAAGPRGSQSFSNDARFHAWLKGLWAFNQAHGLRAVTALSIDATPLGPRHVLASVRWGARFVKTGERVVEFRISYLLEGAAADWKVLAYVSEADQEEQMKKLGLL